MGGVFPILVFIWALSLPGFIVGIILTAAGKPGSQTRKGGLILLLISVAVLIIGLGSCLYMLNGLSFH